MVVAGGEDKRGGEAGEIEDGRPQARGIEVGETSTLIAHGVLLDVRIPVQVHRRHVAEPRIEALADDLDERRVGVAKVRVRRLGDTLEERGILVEVVRVVSDEERIFQ